MAKGIMTLIVVVLLAIGFCIGLVGGCNDGYSDGVREGDLIKMSTKGFIWKSGEGELKLAEFGPKAEPWDFSCRDEDLIKQLKAATGEKVKLTYKQWMIKPAQIDTKYEITAVEVQN